jgi:hypothetical protein
MLRDREDEHDLEHLRRDDAATDGAASPLARAVKSHIFKSRGTHVGANFYSIRQGEKRRQHFDVCLSSRSPEVLLLHYPSGSKAVDLRVMLEL